MSNRPATEEEQQFLQKAAQGGKAEVEMGRLAQQKSSSEAVKKIGKTLEKDHQKANSRLEKLASNLGTQVPNQPNEKQSAAAQHLESLSGTEFNREFLEHMAKDHDKDIQEFEQAASRFDGPVKKFASQTLPSLRKHREMIGKAMNQADTQTGSSSGSTESSKTAR